MEKAEFGYFLNSSRAAITPITSTEAQGGKGKLRSPRIRISRHLGNWGWGLEDSTSFTVTKSRTMAMRMAGDTRLRSHSSLSRAFAASAYVPLHASNSFLSGVEGSKSHHRIRTRLAMGS